MDLLEQIVARAKADKQRIVLPEAEEERTLRAADRVLADDIANLILIGNPANIHKLAEEWGLKNIDKATIVDPENNPQSEEYAEKLAELRQKKGMTLEQARELVTKNNLYLGCMIIKTGGADGQISGALSTTGDTLRPALQIIKCAPVVERAPEICPSAPPGLRTLTRLPLLTQRITHRAKNMPRNWLNYARRKV